LFDGPEVAPARLLFASAWLLILGPRRKNAVAMGDVDQPAAAPPPTFNLNRPMPLCFDSTLKSDGGVLPREQRGECTPWLRDRLPLLSAHLNGNSQTSDSESTLEVTGGIVDWLWQVDEGDEPVGRVERGEAHDRGVLHRSGIVFLLDERRRVYLVERAASKSIFPSRYDSSASFHVEHGESYAGAARREAVEELGLDKPVIEIGKFRHDDPPEHQFVGVFAMAHAGEAIALDPSEAVSGAFYTLDDAARIVRDEACTPWQRDGLPWLVAYVQRLDAG
jgi:isopentenyldiphosphate isomerase